MIALVLLILHDETHKTKLKNSRGARANDDDYRTGLLGIMGSWNLLGFMYGVAKSMGNEMKLKAQRADTQHTKHTISSTGVFTVGWTYRDSLSIVSGHYTQLIVHRILFMKCQYTAFID